MIFQDSHGAFQQQRTEIQYIQKHCSLSSGQFLSISYNVLGRSHKYRSLKEKKKCPACLLRLVVHVAYLEDSVGCIESVDQGKR